jgi:hypothetical protein
MPVTTRSQSKRLQISTEAHSFTSMSDPSVFSSTFLPTSTCNHSTTASLTVSTCNRNTTTSSFHDTTIIPSNTTDSPITTSSNLTTLSTPSFSKFQNSEISKSEMFYPGIVPSQCHNCSVSNFVTMEVDCQDAANNNGASLKQEAFPDLNQFLSAITSKITAATTQMSNDFHTIISANTAFKQETLDANMDFKQEVRDELRELCMLISQQQQTFRSTTSVPSGIQTHVSASNPPQLSHIPVSGPSLSPSLSNVPTSTLPTTTDRDLQMLTDSFAKMATALTEKQGDLKAEWPGQNFLEMQKSSIHGTWP